MALFSTTIKVPVDLLREQAEQMQRFADSNADIFDRLYNSLRCLKGDKSWEGDSLEAAMEATFNNQKKFQETVKELQELADFLSSFVEEIDAKDQQIKKKITSV